MFFFSLISEQFFIGRYVLNVIYLKIIDNKIVFNIRFIEFLLLELIRTKSIRTFIELLKIFLLHNVVHIHSIFEKK